MLEDGGEFGVAIGHVDLFVFVFGAGRVCEDADDLAEREERLVDVDAFFGEFALCARQSDSL